jgi:DNA mismatch repair protein MutS2
MGFRVSKSTLESLEWSRVADELRSSCRTPQGRLRLSNAAPDALFEAHEADVRRLLRETSEARALIDQGMLPPLGGCCDLDTPLSLAMKGGVLESTMLLDIRATLEALHATQQFFDRHRDENETLCELTTHITALPELEASIARCLDSTGEVSDAASPTLAQARREAHRLGGDLKHRIERSLGNSEIAAHLSDQFYTVRNGRFVLPVKADAKGHVRGIVHDASRSGTTLYVEPEGMVELNNRHRQAELTVEREILRVLRELSVQVGEAVPVLRANLESLSRLDLALARGQYSSRLEGVEPRVECEGIFELPGLRHPLIPGGECVPNDLRVGADFSVLILSGPNAGGKTVALKSMALAALMVRAGMHVAAHSGARVDLVDQVQADIGDHQDIRESLSTFSAAMASLAEILREADGNAFICLDEIGVGTDPSEGAAIAQSALESLADSGARTITTTHYNLLKEMAEVDERFENASVEFDPETLAPTYRVRIGSPGASSATTVAARMGMPQRVLDRASELLDHEDRRLDRMLTELSATRASLEAEKQAARDLRLESEQARETYRAKLARLQERRDKLFGEMRQELDDSFRPAHSEVARVIRELQRQPSSRKAANVREQLVTLREETEQFQIETGLTPAGAAESTDMPPVDWPRARVGDSVRTPGGTIGRLLALPDRRGRVSVQVAGSKLSLDRERLGAVAGVSPGAAPLQKRTCVACESTKRSRNWRRRSTSRLPKGATNCESFTGSERGPFARPSARSSLARPMSSSGTKPNATRAAPARRVRCCERTDADERCRPRESGRSTHGVRATVRSGSPARVRTRGPPQRERDPRHALRRGIALAAADRRARQFRCVRSRIDRACGG